MSHLQLAGLFTAFVISSVAFADVKLTHYRIDAGHGNSCAAWLKMGSPLPLSDKQYSELEKAGQFTELEPQKNLRVKDGKLDLNFPLPRQGVSLLVLTWNEVP